MKVLNILIIFLFLQSGYAQDVSGILEGSVVKSGTSQPLGRVNVTVLQTSLGDATDAKGFFRIVGLKPGEYEVEIRLIGYRTTRRRIHIERGKTRRIQVALETEILEGSEVTVESERSDCKTFV